VEEAGGVRIPIEHQIRKYKLPNPDGEYQMWDNDNLTERNLSEQYIKTRYPKITVEKMSQVVACACYNYRTNEMKELLQQMNTLHAHGAFV
jgi:hypothetical protein